MRAYMKEMAAGLMTVAMALPLAAEPGAYRLSDNGQSLGFAVAGAPGTAAGMMVAMPVGGDKDEHASKPSRQRSLRTRHAAP